MRDAALSDYGRRSMTPSPVSRMLNQFTHDFRDGRDINLGVGYVNEKTIPVTMIRQALEEVTREGSPYRQPLNYGSPQGSPRLIRSIRNYYKKNRLGGLSDELLDEREVVIGANGATSILESFSQVLKKGTVITGEPMYYIYTEFLERMGFSIRTVPEDKDGILPDRLRALLDSKELKSEEISFAYIITVNNPSSSLLTNPRRREIMDIFQNFSRSRNRRIPLIFDKAYEDLIHDQTMEKPLSPITMDDLGQVYEVGTLSKVIAPALRMGYMIAPRGPLTDSLIQRVSDAGFSASLINQEITSWLLDNHLNKQLDGVNKGYREKASILKPAVLDILGPWLEECIGGSAGFYLYLVFKTIKTGEGSLFFNYLNRVTGVDDIDCDGDEKRDRVIYIPGEFCVSPKGETAEKGSRSLRLSYGYESTDNVIRSLKYMARACRWVEDH